MFSDKRIENADLLYFGVIHHERAILDWQNSLAQSDGIPEFVGDIEIQCGDVSYKDLTIFDRVDNGLNELGSSQIVSLPRLNLKFRHVVASVFRRRFECLADLWRMVG